MSARILALVAGLLCLTIVANAETCRVVASLPMGMDEANRPNVPAEVNGQPVTMLVDTGGIFTQLAERTVSKLGLPVIISQDSRLFMFGGEKLTRFAKASFRLGTLKPVILTFPLISHGDMPPSDDGILSPDLIANYDADFDFANAKFTLFKQEGCADKFFQWAQHGGRTITKIPFAAKRAVEEIVGSQDIETQLPQILIEVQLDGKDVRAFLDTGASTSVLSLDAAQSLFGLSETSPGMKATRALRDSYVYPFKTLSFSGVTVANPAIVVVPKSTSQMGPNGPDMIVGMDVLRRLHLYVAYEDKVIYAMPAAAH